MGQERTELDEERRQRDNITGIDLPDADGQVSDEDAALRKDREGKPTGQDHSTENYGETMPDGGVGGVQNEADRGSSVADISD
ncbi:MAG: hypothetical protein H0V76_01365 [Blastocatellia bacterium]|nr:hypothetical protein [Blastocatellia bacterium]